MRRGDWSLWRTTGRLRTPFSPCDTFRTHDPGAFDMEISALQNRLKDLDDRVHSLRGYL